MFPFLSYDCSIPLIDGSTLIISPSYTKHIFKGKYHCLTGPAISYHEEGKERKEHYYIMGKEYSKEDFEIAIRSVPWY